MKNLENLLNREMTLVELDNNMEALGYNSIFDEVDETTLKMNSSASYDDILNIEFDVIDDENNIVKITNIEEI